MKTYPIENKSIKKYQNILLIKENKMNQNSGKWDKENSKKIQQKKSFINTKTNKTLEKSTHIDKQICQRSFEQICSNKYCKILYHLCKNQ
jgi:hypothetical protein